MENAFSEEFTIASYDLNPRGQARLTTMANFFQEMAYQHADQLGFGFKDMNRRHSMWVLSRMKIRMDQYPVWDDRLSVETWHKGMDRIFGLRDFKVRDEAGKVLGVASSAWLILDSQTRRPVRSDSDVLHDKIGEESVFVEKLGKIPLPDQMKEIGRRQVQFSDLDIVRHVNNVKFIEWCIDGLMSEELLDREIRELEINFMHEALLGDTIVFSANETSGSSLDNEVYCLAKREEDDQEIIRARMVWD
ncbi:MAG: acyl-ACP thioesterase domain-containing protein [Bacteroidota bacterium]